MSEGSALGKHDWRDLSPLPFQPIGSLTTDHLARQSISRIPWQRAPCGHRGDHHVKWPIQSDNGIATYVWRRDGAWRARATLDRGFARRAWRPPRGGVRWAPAGWGPGFGLRPRVVVSRKATEGCRRVLWVWGPFGGGLASGGASLGLYDGQAPRRASAICSLARARHRQWQRRSRLGRSDQAAPASHIGRGE
jgi:hypothetical protein